VISTHYTVTLQPGARLILLLSNLQEAPIYLIISSSVIQATVLLESLRQRARVIIKQLWHTADYAQEVVKLRRNLRSEDDHLLNMHCFSTHDLS